MLYFNDVKVITNKPIKQVSFANRVNNIIETLGDNWLDLSEELKKKTLKAVILTSIPAQCN